MITGMFMSVFVLFIVCGIWNVTCINDNESGSKQKYNVLALHVWLFLSNYICFWLI